MARTARTKSATGIYHIMLRGVGGMTLFFDDMDYRKFLKTMCRIKAEAAYNIYAFCLMGNHVHLMLQETGEPLPTILKRIGITYAAYYNKKYDRYGHVFQDRYRSEAVETDAYFWDVLRYICQNPVKAGLCTCIQDYMWLGCTGFKDEFHLLSPHDLVSERSKEEVLTFLSQPCHDVRPDDCGGRRLLDKEAEQLLCNACHCKKTAEFCQWPVSQQNQAIWIGLQLGISTRQMARITGFSKYRIEKVSGKMKE